MEAMYSDSHAVLSDTQVPPAVNMTMPSRPPHYPLRPTLLSSSTLRPVPNLRGFHMDLLWEVPLDELFLEEDFESRWYQPSVLSPQVADEVLKVISPPTAAPPVAQLTQLPPAVATSSNGETDSLPVLGAGSVRPLSLFGPQNQANEDPNFNSQGVSSQNSPEDANRKNAVRKSSPPSMFSKVFSCCAGSSSVSVKESGRSKGYTHHQTHNSGDAEMDDKTQDSSRGGIDRTVSPSLAPSSAPQSPRGGLQQQGRKQSILSSLFVSHKRSQSLVSNAMSESVHSLGGNPHHHHNVTDPKLRSELTSLFTPSARQRLRRPVPIEYVDAPSTNKARDGANQSSSKEVPQQGPSPPRTYPSPSSAMKAAQQIESAAASVGHPPLGPAHLPHSANAPQQLPTLDSYAAVSGHWARLDCPFPNSQLVPIATPAMHSTTAPNSTKLGASITNSRVGSPTLPRPGSQSAFAMGASMASQSISNQQLTSPNLGNHKAPDTTDTTTATSTATSKKLPYRGTRSQIITIGDLRLQATLAWSRHHKRGGMPIDRDALVVGGKRGSNAVEEVRDAHNSNSKAAGSNAFGLVKSLVQWHDEKHQQDSLPVAASNQNQSVSSNSKFFSKKSGSTPSSPRVGAHGKLQPPPPPFATPKLGSSLSNNPASPSGSHNDPFSEDTLSFILVALDDYPSPANLFKTLGIKPEAVVEEYRSAYATMVESREREREQQQERAAHQGEGQHLTAAEIAISRSSVAVPDHAYLEHVAAERCFMQMVSDGDKRLRGGAENKRRLAEQGRGIRSKRGSRSASIVQNQDTPQGDPQAARSTSADTKTDDEGAKKALLTKQVEEELVAVGMALGGSVDVPESKTPWPILRSSTSAKGFHPFTCDHVANSSIDDATDPFDDREIYALNYVDITGHIGGGGGGDDQAAMVESSKASNAADANNQSASERKMQSVRDAFKNSGRPPPLYGNPSAGSTSSALGIGLTNVNKPQQTPHNNSSSARRHFNAHEMQHTWERRCSYQVEVLSSAADSNSPARKRVAEGVLMNSRRTMGFLDLIGMNKTLQSCVFESDEPLGYHNRAGAEDGAILDSAGRKASGGKRYALRLRIRIAISHGPTFLSQLRYYYYLHTNLRIMSALRTKEAELWGQVRRVAATAAALSKDKRRKSLPGSLNRKKSIEGGKQSIEEKDQLNQTEDHMPSSAKLRQNGFKTVNGGLVVDPTTLEASPVGGGTLNGASPNVLPSLRRAPLAHPTPARDRLQKELLGQVEGRQQQHTKHSDREGGDAQQPTENGDDFDENAEKEEEQVAEEDNDEQLANTMRDTALQAMVAHPLSTTHFGRTGLFNHGITCFVNSVLQLCHNCGVLRWDIEERAIKILETIQAAIEKKRAAKEAARKEKAISKLKVREGRRSSLKGLAVDSTDEDEEVEAAKNGPRDEFVQVELSLDDKYLMALESVFRRLDGWSEEQLIEAGFGAVLGMGINMTNCSVDGTLAGGVGGSQRQSTTGRSVAVNSHTSKSGAPIDMVGTLPLLEVMGLPPTQQEDAHEFLSFQVLPAFFSHLSRLHTIPIMHITSPENDHKTVLSTNKDIYSELPLCVSGCPTLESAVAKEFAISSDTIQFNTIGKEMVTARRRVAVDVSSAAAGDAGSTATSATNRAPPTPSATQAGANIASTLPPILLMHAKRFDSQLKKIHVRQRYPFLLNAAKVIAMVEGEAEGQGADASSTFHHSQSFTKQLALEGSGPSATAADPYVLYGVVVHHGNRADSGHYTCYVRTPIATVPAPAQRYLSGPGSNYEVLDTDVDSDSAASRVAREFSEMNATTHESGASATTPGRSTLHHQRPLGDVYFHYDDELVHPVTFTQLQENIGGTHWHCPASSAYVLWYVRRSAWRTMREAQILTSAFGIQHQIIRAPKDSAAAANALVGQDSHATSLDLFQHLVKKQRERLRALSDSARLPQNPPLIPPQHIDYPLAIVKAHLLPPTVAIKGGYRVRGTEAWREALHRHILRQLPNELTEKLVRHRLAHDRHLHHQGSGANSGTASTDVSRLEEDADGPRGSSNVRNERPPTSKTQRYSDATVGFADPTTTHLPAFENMLHGGATAVTTAHTTHNNTANTSMCSNFMHNGPYSMSASMVPRFPSGQLNASNANSKPQSAELRHERVHSNLAEDDGSGMMVFSLDAGAPISLGVTHAEVTPSRQTLTVGGSKPVNDAKVATISYSNPMLRAGGGPEDAGGGPKEASTSTFAFSTHPQSLASPSESRNVGPSPVNQHSTSQPFNEASVSKPEDISVSGVAISVDTPSPKHADPAIQAAHLQHHALAAANFHATVPFESSPPPREGKRLAYPSPQQTSATPATPLHQDASQSPNYSARPANLPYNSNQVIGAMRPPPDTDSEDGDDGAFSPREEL